MAAEKMIPLTPMPPAPQQKVDPPAVFSDKAEVYVAAQVKLVDEINSKIIPAHNSLVNPANQVLAALPAILVAPDKAEQATLAAQEAGVSRAAALASKNAASAAEANARACEAISVSSKDIAVAKANEASASATVASAAEAVAVASKDTAVAKANEASASATVASAAEAVAVASETAAQGSKIAAQAAQTGAEKARDEAQAIAGGDYVTRYTEQVITGKKTFSAGLIGDLEGNAGTATRAQSAAQADAVPWAGVTDKPAAFPPATHGHGWDEVSGKPGSFPPASHTHPAGDLTGLQSPFFRGFIAPFYGSLGGTGSKYPVINGVAQTAWHVCDGTDGTPNMRDRVPLGASSSKGMGSTGGGESKTVGGSVSVNSASVAVSGTVGETTLTEQQMPRHYHGNGTFYGSAGLGNKPVGSPGQTQLAGGSQSHTHTLTATGSSHSHSASFSGSSLNVMQPYIALHYIMYMG